MPDDLTHMYSNIYCSPTSETNLPSMWKMQRTCHYWIASSLTILNKPALISSRLKKIHLDKKKIRGFFLWGSLRASELSSESLELSSRPMIGDSSGLKVDDSMTVSRSWHVGAVLRQFHSGSWDWGLLDFAWFCCIFNARKETDLLVSFGLQTMGSEGTKHWKWPMKDF